MARKAVVINDPSVREMSDAQWIFEAAALRRKEKEDFEVRFEAFQYVRRAVVDMLGLNIGQVVSEDEDFDYTLPLSMLIGHPETLQFHVKAAQEKADGEVMPDADEDFDKLSEYLMKSTKPGVEYDEGDMLPFAAPIDVNSDRYRNAYMHTEEYKRTHDQMVRPRKAVVTVNRTKVDEDNG